MYCVKFFDPLRFKFEDAPRHNGLIESDTGSPETALSAALRLMEATQAARLPLQRLLWRE
jgi:hypothetical protein